MLKFTQILFVAPLVAFLDPKARLEAFVSLLQSDEFLRVQSGQSACPVPARKRICHGAKGDQHRKDRKRVAALTPKRGLL